MFCPKCGAENPDGSNFCQKCGINLAPESAQRTGTSTGLEPNVAGLLCYVLVWITGLAFIILEKENHFVRFHAMQSIATFGPLSVLCIIFWLLMAIPFIGAIFWLLNIVTGILGLVLWIILMVKAYQGERFRLPIAGDFAEKHI